MRIIQKRFFPLFVSGLLLVLFASCGQENSRVEHTNQSQTEEYHPVLLISIDGLMTKYLDRNETPAFDRLRETGVMADALIPVFPTKTYPTHYSLVTGLYVENHGIISNSFYDHELEARFSYGPPEEGPGDDLWWGGEPIWVTAEKQSRTSATMFWPGSDSEISGVRPSRYKDYDGSVPNLARIDTVIAWLDPEGEVQADFATLYFSDVDSDGHRYGPDSPEVDESVREADHWIEYLLDRLDETGLSGKLNIIVVSDHGMAETSEDHLIFLEELIDLNDVDVIGWTPVAMLRPEEGKKEEVYNRLKANEEGYRVYLKEELPEVYRFQNHTRIPDILMLADIPYTITSRSHFADRGIPAGMHGFDHRAPEMEAFFLANGPSFAVNLKVDTVDSIHLYEMMCYLMGLEPAPNDGSIDSVRHLLR